MRASDTLTAVLPFQPLHVLYKVCTMLPYTNPHSFSVTTPFFISFSISNPHQDHQGSWTKTDIHTYISVTYRAAKEAFVVEEGEQKGAGEKRARFGWLNLAATKPIREFRGVLNS